MGEGQKLSPRFVVVEYDDISHVVLILCNPQNYIILIKNPIFDAQATRKVR